MSYGVKDGGFRVSCGELRFKVHQQEPHQAKKKCNK